MLTEIMDLDLDTAVTVLACACCDLDDADLSHFYIAGMKSVSCG